MRINAFLFSVVLFQFLPLVGIAYGQKTPEVADFRIDSDIYDDERKPPLYSIQTIFCAGQYIELDDKNGRVTVVDPGKGRVTILDSKQKALVHLEMQSLENQLNHVLESMTPAQQKKFKSDGITYFEADNFITIGNEWFRYKFRAVTPSNPNIAISYGDFANWTARVNALHYKAPQFIRMELNQLLIDQRQLPVELRRYTMLPPSPTEPKGKTEEIIARLILKDSLSNNDRTRVANVLKSMTEFKPTTEKEFFR